MVDIVTSVSLWELLKHAGSWIRNLSRASKERKKESIAAVREVITASRTTAIYMRRLHEKKGRDFDRETQLSQQWTSLGFRLADLGLSELAKKCDVSGRHWSDPAQFDAAFLEKADVSLESMEKSAQLILREFR